MNLLREKKAQLVILETVIYYQLYLNQLHLVFGPWPCHPYKRWNSLKTVEHKFFKINLQDYFHVLLQSKVLISKLNYL